MKKIIVTGATGFLGSNLIEELIDQDGYYVYAFSSRGDELQKDNKSGNVHFFHKDSLFSEDLSEILKDAFIINCAFPRNSTGTGMADGLRYIHNVFSISRTAGAKAIVNISSQSVYSQKRNELATEMTQVCLESPYAVGKFATELMLEDACRGTKMVYTNLRMASLIGPGFDQRIVNRLTKQALEGEAILVVRSNQHFGFLDIEDAVRAILALINTSTNTWKPIYNVGNGKEYSIEDIVKCISYVFNENNLNAPKICIKEGDGYGSTGVSYQSLNCDTGYKPEIMLEDSVRQILYYLQVK
ncbi:NAD(P)-dependent oxidoreductase [Claveliimonas bilis]|uniref:NAD-dependent epimerase/dehydratase family protein n=1 Tax=Claveliimonas bilis TaxID=3028070 RepID=UPI00292E7500|nr:NAD(P)-dependent oxidoreductase [Claveliimonas bilis]